MTLLTLNALSPPPVIARVGAQAEDRLVRPDPDGIRQADRPGDEDDQGLVAPDLVDERLRVGDGDRRSAPATLGPPLHGGPTDGAVAIAHRRIRIASTADGRRTGRRGRGGRVRAGGAIPAANPLRPTAEGEPPQQARNHPSAGRPGDDSKQQLRLTATSGPDGNPHGDGRASRPSCPRVSARSIHRDDPPPAHRDCQSHRAATPRSPGKDPAGDVVDDGHRVR